MIKLIVRPDPPERPAQTIYGDILVSFNRTEPSLTHVSSLGGVALPDPEDTLVGDAGNWAFQMLQKHPGSTIEIVRVAESVIGVVRLEKDAEGNPRIATLWKRKEQ